MILKQKDTRTEDIQELNRLLGLNISSKQRFLIERELKCLMSGNSGENPRFDICRVNIPKSVAIKGTTQDRSALCFSSAFMSTSIFAPLARL